MGRKITNLERTNSKAPRIALTAFRANPLLGECEAQALITEIVSLLIKGMTEADIVQALCENHTTNKPVGQLSLM